MLAELSAQAKLTDGLADVSCGSANPLTAVLHIA